MPERIWLCFSKSFLSLQILFTKALVNSIWSDKNDLEKHNQILSGMSFACEKFNVPMVGGHSNQKSHYTALSVSILGMVDGPILSSRLILKKE